MVETTAGLLAGRAEPLDRGDARLPVRVAERRVVDRDVRGGDALGLAGTPRGSCSWCADRRSRCLRAPSASRRRPSSGSRPPESPAGSARRRCRSRSSTTPRPRTAPGRRAGRCSSRTPAAPTCCDTDVQQPKTTATLSFSSSSRAFSAKSGQSDAGSTTTASSFRPSSPPFLFCSSISIRTVSLSVVSLMAIVPDSECSTPTLMVACCAMHRHRKREAGRHEARGD